MTQIEYITNLLKAHTYESDAILLGNVTPSLMTKTKTFLEEDTTYNTALVDCLTPHIIQASQLNDEDIIFEYLWGLVYNYLATIPQLKEKYIDSTNEKKLAFFKTLLENPFDVNLLRNNSEKLFSHFPDRTRFFIDRNSFKIGILNYQVISSNYLIKSINSIIRSGPPHIPIFILTQTQGLKSHYTNGDEWINVENDFHYYDVKNQNKNGYRLEKTL